MKRRAKRQKQKLREAAKMNINRCPVDKEFVHPANEPFTYYVVEGRKCRSTTTPPGEVPAGVRIYQVHEKCSQEFERRVAKRSL